MSRQSYDVAVVGLGPAGATAALLFAEAGLTVAAFERDRDIYPLPRAVAMDGEVVRAFQRVGRGEELARLLQPTRRGSRAGFANSKREWLFGQPFVEFGANGWPPTSMFDQPEIDAYLRKCVVEHPRVTSFIGHEVVSWEDSGDQVMLRSRCADPAAGEVGTEGELAARYLVGCDGAASGIRRALDIGWHDLGYDHEWLVVDVVVKPGHQLGEDTLQVCDPDRLTTYVVTKDPYRRWEFKLNAGETREQMLQPEKIHALLDTWTPRDTYEVRRSAVYQFHAATADRWRQGRVFLAGDAAHQTPPFLGQGMNAGLRDVVNLAWKLPLVISGLAGDPLLDTYEAERSAHAQDLVQWAVAVGQLMEHQAAVEAAERQGLPPSEVPAAARASGYGQGREAPPLRDGAVMVEQVSDRGSTGYLFRQPVVRDSAGAEFRFDERLGAGFAIVARSAADLQVNAQSRQLMERLGMVATALEGLEVCRGHFDPLFETAAAAVVRPDRYVFGHVTDNVSLDGLLEALRVRLCLA